MMKPLLLPLLVVLAACETPLVAPRQGAGSPIASVNGNATCTLANGNVVSRGFDALGYNRCAHNFVGAADGVDGTLDGTVWGDPTYAKDHLVMKWNEEWDRGNAEGWTNPPYAAYLDNQWNGMRPDGSKYTEHFKTRWAAECVGVADGTPTPDGGYCLWGAFEALMDQGMSPSGQYWYAHALPNGYGH
jgi:hypothetical protein